MQETRSSTTIDDLRELASCKTLGISTWTLSGSNTLPELRIHVLDTFSPHSLRLGIAWAVDNPTSAGQQETA